MKISHSAKETYLECPRKYFNHYMLKLRATEEKSPLVFGDAIDTGLNTLLETRDLQKAKDAFLIKWNAVNYKNVRFSKADLEDHLIEPGMAAEDTVECRSWVSLREKGILMLEEYDDQIMPKIKTVVAVQINKFIPNGTGDELNIKTDFICEWEDGRVILFDNKTSSVRYDENSVKESTQLATYFEMLKDEYKIETCGFIVIPKKTNKRKKPRVEIKIIIDDIPEETIAKTFADYDQVLNGVKSATFPMNQNSCIGKFGRCQYFDYCHNGDKKGLSEK